MNIALQKKKKRPLRALEEGPPKSPPTALLSQKVGWRENLCGTQLVNGMPWIHSEIRAG